MTYNFTRINNIKKPIISDNTLILHKRFVSLLGNKLYNLDQREHCKEVTKAMLIAYKETVDPKIVEKLMHLNKGYNIKFNTNFLMDLSSLIKSGLL